MGEARYPISVFWSSEDRGYIATAIDLPGCSAFGETQEEAILQLQDAISAWIEAATLAGNKIPEPSQPAFETYSGRFVVRVPKFLHRELVTEAKSEGTSLNQYVLCILSSRHSQSYQLASYETNNIKTVSFNSWSKWITSWPNESKIYQTSENLKVFGLISPKSRAIGQISEV